MRSVKTILVALLLTIPAWSAVAIDASFTAVTSANSVIVLNSTNLTIGAGANRALVCYVAFGSSSNPVDPGTVTVIWDTAGTPQNLTVITGTTVTVTGRQTSIWGLIAPTSGNKNLQVNTQVGHSVDAAVFCKSFTGVNQTGGATSFPNGTNTSGAGANPSLTITSATNDWTMSVLADASTNPSAPNRTQDYVDTTLANMNSAAENATGAASIAHSWTATANSWVMSGTSIKASGSATASRTPAHGDAF